MSNMNEILQEILTDINEEISTKNASITIDSLPALQVNSRLMRMLFHNLINQNALKYSKKDIQPQIKIFSENNLISRSRDKRFCRIFVEDNGIGFDQKYAEDIFGMFKRLHHDSEFKEPVSDWRFVKKLLSSITDFISAQSEVNSGSKVYCCPPSPASCLATIFFPIILLVRF